MLIQRRRIKFILYFLCFLTLFLYSCRLPEDNPYGKGNFWAINCTTNKPYKLYADLLVEGVYCDVWAERNKGIDEETARKVANVYDEEIYERMIEAFSIENFSVNVIEQGQPVIKSFSNIMEFANWLVNGNGKLNILLLDIKDNYKKGINDASVGGYFYGADFTNYFYSNKRMMIYIDIDPGEPGDERSNRTLAHEMQHLMNFVTDYLARRDKNNNVYSMDIWINEGLSSAAEYIYVNKHLEDRVYDYYRDFSGLIARGNNFFVWGNREGTNDGEDINAVLDDYCTVYLFFQWLRIQNGSTDIYKKIIASPFIDYEAVTDVAGKINTDYGNWGKLLKTWMAANYFNNPNGPYGYYNELSQEAIKPHYAPKNNKEIALYPGEGVYSITNEDGTVPINGTNIRYAGLGSTLSDVNIFSGGALLTYNVNAEKIFNNDGTQGGHAETGVTTGVVPPSSSVSIVRNSINGGRSALQSDFAPFQIDASDMLRRNGFKSGFDKSFNRSNVVGRGFVIYE